MEENNGVQQFAPNPAYVETRPAVVYVGTVQPQGAVPGATGTVYTTTGAATYNQHPQIQALNQYQVAQAVPVTYGKA